MLTLSCDTMDISIRDGVTLIQLTGGSATQSFSREFLPKIRDAIIGSIGCKAIVITGEGNFFSAGADIKAFQKSIEDGDSVDPFERVEGCGDQVQPRSLLRPIGGTLVGK